MPTFFDTYQSGLTCKLLLAPLPTLGCPCLLSGVTIGTTDTRWQNTEHYRQNYSLAPTITFIIPIYIRAKGGVIVFRLEGRGVWRKELLQVVGSVCAHLEMGRFGPAPAPTPYTAPGPPYNYLLCATNVYWRI